MQPTAYNPPQFAPLFLVDELHWDMTVALAQHMIALDLAWIFK